MIKYILVIVFFALALLEINGMVSITAQVSRIVPVLVLIIIISCFMRINGASYFFLALLLLGICAGGLSVNNLMVAEKAATWSYLSMIVGLSISVFEFSSNSHSLYKKRNRD